ncbi:hypothetical protein N7474_000307 [Penicillium riverlandense]|uniref:uncharacterized protein n=1 Tax=Penicillium riverlandense TaxID=1903569 RepID=UPI00254886E6|nr:uncharacterized protein N7474_000307 [Penicillium riverlandense]KAJ5831996.1 hypothetical protein N7474_000307 [Penicillium riverlandense]
MRLSFITCLLTLLAVAMAVPVAHGDHSASIQASSLSKAASSSLSHKPSSTALTATSASAKTTATVAAYACPTKQYKQCCQTIDNASKKLIGPLGKLVPLVGGIQLSSSMTFQCKPMKDDAYPECEDGASAMCCNSQAEDFNSCKPFEEAKEKAEMAALGEKPESEFDVVNEAVS